MREINFRGWDGKEIIENWFQIEKSSGGKGVLVPKTMNRMVINIMQYTGLKDRNNKKIYEGDLVNYWQEDKEQAPYNIQYVAFELGSFVLKNIGDRVGSGTGGSMWQNKEFVRKECKVIGNIYENPKIIKEYKKLK